MMDDSIEPEVMRNVHGATHKKAMPSSQVRAAAAAAAAAESISTPAESAVASTSPTRLEESPQPACRTLHARSI